MLLIVIHPMVNIVIMMEERLVQIQMDNIHAIHLLFFKINSVQLLMDKFAMISVKDGSLHMMDNM